MPNKNQTLFAYKRSACIKFFDAKLNTYLCFFKGCIEKYIDILDGKCRTKLLKSVYAGIHERPEDDPDLQDFFRFKCWI